MGFRFTPTHTARHTNTRCGYVVSPVAAQLIQTLATPLPQPPLCPPGSPSLGITQRRWALTSSAVGREPAAGAEAGGRMRGRQRNLRGGFIKEE